jgi:hypothetical protein
MNIVELDIRDKHMHEINVGFRWNFAESTSKEVNYLNSPHLRAFLMTCLKAITKHEGKEILNFTPRKKDDTLKSENMK